MHKMTVKDSIGRNVTFEIDDDGEAIITIDTVSHGPVSARFCTGSGGDERTEASVIRTYVASLIEKMFTVYAPYAIVQSDRLPNSKMLQKGRWFFLSSGHPPEDKK